MTSLKSKQDHAEAAKTLASTFELVQHGTTTYIPAHWDTEESQPLPLPHERIWLPLSRRDKEELGRSITGILFHNDSEVSNFSFMLRQLSIQAKDVQPRLLMRTPEGLKVLTETGELIDSDGTFLPNYIRPRLNPDEGLKKEVFDCIKSWVDSESEAHSLLYHLASCLSPGWSAAKYVLLIGDGRNGKSMLLQMLADLFGKENTSMVTRQNMAEKGPVCTELNGKLLNVVFDGQAEYLKDSGAEKSLVAGETIGIRLLYESTATPVQTNALFVEGLNKEPKSRDKSSALQKRLVRYWFPQVYERNLQFERHMRTEEMLGAFLSVLMDHFVQEHEQSTKLALSATSMELQLEQMHSNSPVLQFLEYAVLEDPLFMDKLDGAFLDPIINSFMGWRVTEGYDTYSSADALALFKEHFHVYFRSTREKKRVVKKRAIRSAKPATLEFVRMLIEEGEGGEDEDTAELVAD